MDYPVMPTNYYTDIEQLYYVNYLYTLCILLLYNNNISLRPPLGGVAD